MAYTKTVWKNRLVEKPGTGILQQNADGTVTFIAKEGNIIEAGTPVNAENLNKIEDTLASHDTQLTQIPVDMAKKAPLASPSFTGTPKAPSGATDYTTARLRNIYFSTNIPTSMANGDICLTYE